MNRDQYVLNSDPDAKWREGPIEAWFKDVEDLINIIGPHGSSGDPKASHSKEDDLLWEFVRHVYERSTEPCIHGMCDALFGIDNIPDRTRWYS